MKRKIVLILAMVLAVGMLCACSKDSEDTTTGTATSASTDVTYEPITLITDWDTMATITLGDTITIDGDGATAEDSVVEITEGGEYIFAGSLTEGAILVNTDKDVKITLNGVDITNSTGPAIYGENSESIYVSTAEGTTNTLTDGTAYDTTEDQTEVGKGVIHSNDDLVILGEGSLVINGNYKHGIVSDNDVYVESGTIQITAATDAIHANNIVCVDDGTITVDAASDGMESEAVLVLNGGIISVESDDEGIEGKYSITVNGGDVSISCTDDGYNAGSELEINGGSSYIVTAQGDAIDSNGTLTINDGMVAAFGGSAPEGGLDCDQAEISINGGMVIATGDANSTISEDSEQISILLGSFHTGDNIGILDADGNTVFAFTAPVSSSNMIVSIDGITSGESYEVYTGGTIAGTETYHGYYEGATYSGGSVSQSFTADTQVISAGGSATSMGGGQGQMQQGGRKMAEDGEMPSDDGTQMQRPDMSEDTQKNMGSSPSGTPGSSTDTTSDSTSTTL